MAVNCFIVTIGIVAFTSPSTHSYLVQPRIVGINNISPRSISSAAALSADLIESIAIGTQVAYDHCQRAFKWDRWNCPASTFARRYKHTPTREIAYAKAILSASIVHTITKNCSRGELSACGCDVRPAGATPMIPDRVIDEANQFNRTELTPSEPITWAWRGCSDDVGFGSKMAEAYLDELEASLGPQAEIHLHNNQIGREIVRETMVKRCVCHGVSGSCTLQTCWMQVVPFEIVASKLKENYRRSVRIEVESDNTAADNLIVHIPDDSHRNLIYLDESPNYCKADNVTGVAGTKGRTCSRSKLQTATLEEKRSCRNLCRGCGYRVRKQKRVVRERCDCKFKWCCEVKCDTCTRTIEEFTCE